MFGLAKKVEIDGIRYILKGVTAKVTSQDAYVGTQIEIPEKIEYKNKEYAVTGIDKSAFAGGTGLESVLIPKTVIEIGKGAFADCDNLVIYLVEENRSFGENWNCNRPVKKGVPVKDGELTYAVQSNGKARLIKQTTLLKEITIARQVVYKDKVYPVAEIEESAFVGNKTIESIYIPDSVTKIGARAFGDCIALETAVIPVTLTDVEKNTFGGCVNLKEVVCECEQIPENEKCVTDGKIITARSAGVALDFAFELVRVLKDDETVISLKEKLLCR